MTNTIDMQDNPYNVFKEWLSLAEESELNDPNAMSLATATPDGFPSIRIMLLKGFDEEGFVFYTNTNSRKGQEIQENKNAALCFHWKSLRKQVRIEGTLEEVSEEEATAYYNTRPRGSRVGAWASKQSHPLESSEELKKLVDQYETKFEEQKDIPRPTYWTGFRLKPNTIEFWMDGKYRLHERHVYKADGQGGWARNMIHP